VIFIENKSSYPEQLIDESLLTAQTIRVINREEYGTCMVSIDIDEIPNVTIVTYGGVAKMVVEAAKEIFFEEEIIVDVIIPSKIKPIPINDICSMIRNERKILIIEEGQLYAGWGAELECQLYERYFNNVSQPIVRLGAKEIPIPSAPNLERIALPQISDIKAAIRGVFYE
jgi:pyruvate/2-oxoglutarate/acetoin dehydrogenase E1 component